MGIDTANKPIENQADNSRVNVQNRAGTQVTAENQSSDSKDIEITQEIRRELMQDDDLSTYAKNIKVVTRSGKVVVTGPVQSAQERTKIEQIAQNVAGQQNVQNNMTVTQ
jgi:hyperosmotically inducible periplasmic protein